jgi:hypothetical protein
MKNVRWLRICIAAGAIVSPPLFARAANFVVSSSNDSGAGTLRQAIQQANATPDADTITFAAGLSGSIRLLSALPDLQHQLAMIGPASNAVTLERTASASFRLLTVANNARVTIANLTLTNGFAQSGGGVLNSGTLMLNACTIAGNEATGFGEGGGGVLNYGALVVTNSVIHTNRSSNSGGGIRNINGTVSVYSSTIAENAGTTGGGIANHNGTAFVEATTVSGNRSFDAGAGVFNRFGTTRLLNSTVSGNSAQSANGGGGVYVSYGDVFVSFSTIASNLAINSGKGGGIRKEVSATVTIDHTIVAGNRAANGPDLSGTITSGDHNLIAFPGGATIQGATNHNILDVDPALGSLADNGGPTRTHAPSADSPAVDAGDSATAPAVDQRDVARPFGAGVDIGAVEVNRIAEAGEVRIQGIATESSNIVVRFATVGGYSYTLESCPSFANAAWQSIAMVSGNSSVVSIPVAVSADKPVCFFRVRRIAL